MMNSVLPFLILSCVLYKNVVSLLSVVADDISPADGATVKLTCTITPFSVSSSWINNMTTGILSTCDKTGFCSRINFGRYSFSSNSSAIIAEISGFNAAIDDFGWKCLHDAETLVFKFTLTTTTSSPTSTPCSLSPGAIAGIVIGVIVGGCIIVIVVILICYCCSGKRRCVAAAVIILWKRKKCEPPEGILLCKCCKTKKCKGCTDSKGMLICKCCNEQNCKKCATSSGILICTCCNRNDCKGCEAPNVILICKCCSTKNCKGCTDSKGILICKCCNKEKCKAGCEESSGILICKCCNEENCKKFEVVIVILSCISWIRKKCKGNQEDESSSVRRNGRNINQQANSTARNARTSNPQQARMSHNNRVAPDNEQSQSFDQNERRALPMIPTGRNSQTQPGTNLNNIQGQTFETARANQLAPLHRPPQSTNQEEDNSGMPKQKKKKKKNKNIDEG